MDFFFEKQAAEFGLRLTFIISSYPCVMIEWGSWVVNRLSHLKFLEHLLSSYKKKLSVVHDQITSGELCNSPELVDNLWVK